MRVLIEEFIFANLLFVFVSLPSIAYCSDQLFQDINEVIGRVS